jgi:hypothetical protein
MLKLLTLDDVVRHYRNKANVRAEMCRYKWPGGMKCKCGSVDFYPTRKPLLTCLHGETKVSYLEGTFAERSSLSAAVWLAAIRIFGNPRLETQPKVFAKRFGVSYPAVLRMFKKVEEWISN